MTPIGQPAGTGGDAPWPGPWVAPVSARASLQIRQDLLLRRSAELRLQIGQELAPWQRPLKLAESILAFGSWLRRNPEWPLAVVAVFIVIRPRRALRWLRRGLWLWRMWRQVLPIVRGADRV